MTDTAAMITVTGMKKMVRKIGTPASFWLTRVASSSAKPVCRGTTTRLKAMLLPSAFQKSGSSKIRT